jgi:integrase
MPKISKRTVDAITTPEKRQWVWDTELKGFGVAVRPTGTHSYVFNYRDKHGSLRNITIAKVGTITPDEARKRAETLRRDVMDGRSPIADKRAAKTAMTVGELFDMYLASERFKKKAASTQTVDRGRIERHLRPLLGKRVLEALTPSDIEIAHSKIIDGKTAMDAPSGKKRGRVRVRGGEGTARMAIRLLRSILSWGKTAKILPATVSADLVAGIDIGRDGKRDLILDDPEAYARLWRVLDRLTSPDAMAEDDKLLRPEVADAIKVIALTGARKGEIVGLRWHHVDLKAGTLTLPLDAHKTGRKTGQERIIGLPALASAIVARQPAGGPDDLVFRPARGGRCIDLSKPWRTVRDAAALPAGIGLHGLRHSLASHMAMNGAEAAEIMSALGHRDITTSQKYVHWARDKRQALAERAAAGITAAISGTLGQEASNVIDIAEARG